MRGSISSLAIVSARVIVAIHQPNYFPWLGYFHKIAHADTFVFLDDVQFSKGGFTNRVKVLSPAGAKWLTVPVSPKLGTHINDVHPGRPDWAENHCETLKQYYRRTDTFDDVCPVIMNILSENPDSDLASINADLIVAIADRLGLDTRFVRSSSLDIAPGDQEHRLINIVGEIAPGGIYYSGKGGAKYQDPQEFRKAGIELRYSAFEHPVYEQSCEPFEPGLSILDALFHVGWEETRAMILGAE